MLDVRAMPDDLGLKCVLLRLHLSIADLALIGWVAGAELTGAALCARTGAVDMVTAISAAANFLSMTISWCGASALLRRRMFMRGLLGRSGGGHCTG